MNLRYILASLTAIRYTDGFVATLRGPGSLWRAPYLVLNRNTMPACRHMSVPAMDVAVSINADNAAACAGQAQTARSRRAGNQRGGTGWWSPPPQTYQQGGHQQ